jgi:hypothetical protein
MRVRFALIPPLLSTVVACGDNTEPGQGAGSGGAAPMTGGTTSAGAPGTGGSSGGRGGSTSGGTGATSGTPGTGGSASGQGGTSAGTSSGSGGTAATGGSLGPAGSGGTSSGGAGGTGAAGRGSGGVPGGSGSSMGGGPNEMAGGPNAGGCTREFLKGTTDAYFTALAAHDPAPLPRADNLKFTENGKAGTIGAAGLWTTAGALKYKHTAYDTETCHSVSQAVVPDGSTDIPLGLRLKLENQKLTEVEMIAVRQGDYSVASDTAALAASDDAVNWEAPVPEADRNTREEITGWMNKYFRMFPSGVCNTTSNCKRIENGGGSFTCSAGASCSAGQPGAGDNALTPRLILADTETGIGVGFTLFKTGNQTYADVHMFKMFGDQVHGVSALLAKASSTGWD